jgi:two-component system CheB/CheR fusion protein
MTLGPTTTPAPPSWYRRYLVAIVVVVAATGIRWVLWTFTGDRFPFLPFFPAIMLAALYGGFAPGLFATALSVLLGGWFIHPQWPPKLPDGIFIIGMLLFAIVGVIMAWVGDAIRAHREKSERTAQALRESERRFSAFMRHLPGAAWMKGDDGRYVYANPEAERIFKHTIEQLRGRSDEEIFPPDTAAQFRENDQRAKESGQTSVIETLQQEDGVHHSIVSKFSIPADDRAPAAIGGIAFDVTERIRAENALTRERELLQKIIDTIPVMITMYEPIKRFMRLNREFERLVGWKLEDVPGASLMERCYPDPAVRERAREFMLSCREGWMDFPMRTRDGRDIETSWANIRLSDDTRIGIGIDITGRKLAEQALHLAKSEAEKASAAKDEFLAVLSHELRTPLTPVLAAVQLLQMETNLSSDARQTIGMVRRNVELEARLIDDLLDLTRISRGKLQVAREAVDVHQKLHFVEQICRDDVRNKDLKLYMNLEATEHIVAGDPARLQQVFWNLLKNAVKFTPAGGSIRVVTQNRQRGTIEVAITDSGVGIEPDILPRLFNAFEQGGREITRSFGGLGLGLAISRSLIDAHGGTITAESLGKDRGSTFIVSLPVATNLPDEPRRALHSPPRGRLCRILLVEDHPDTSDLMARLLRRSGYSVATADSVSSALHVAAAEPFDILISDLGLPDGSGTDLIRQLLERRNSEPLKAIALSGYGMEQDIQRSKQAGFAEHLIKPVDMDTLQAVVERLLSNTTAAL